MRLRCPWLRNLPEQCTHLVWWPRKGTFGSLGSALHRTQRLQRDDYERDAAGFVGARGDRLVNNSAAPEHARDHVLYRSRNDASTQQAIK
jgi:hypothetical protein